MARVNIIFHTKTGKKFKAKSSKYSSLKKAKLAIPAARQLMDQQIADLELEGEPTITVLDKKLLYSDIELIEYKATLF